MRLRSYIPAIILSSLALQVTAAPVEINILAPARDNNFHYSYTHTAEYADPSGVYYYGGTPTSALSGTLSGDLTAGILTISGGELLRMAKPDGSVPLNSNPYDRVLGRMTLTGSLDFTNQGLNDESLIGSLSYTLYDPAGTETGSGAWYFANRDFSNAVNKPNNLGDDGTLRLWGNNWDPTSRIHYTPGPDGLGIDLGGQVVTAPIPEPASVVLFGAGAAIVGGAVLRKRKQEQD